MKERTLSCLDKARQAVEKITPLTMDCGRVCGGACCRSLEGEETGMLLFPGEELYYQGLGGYRVKEADQGRLLICSGQCRREERPLSCRVFPLLPLWREDGVKVAMDARARAVCPLARQGKAALQQEFAAAVRRCGEILAEDEVQRRFLIRLTEEQDELRAMRRLFGGDGHV